MDLRHPLHSFYMKNIFYDKVDLRLFYFRVTTFPLKTIMFSPEQHYLMVQDFSIKKNKCSFFTMISGKAKQNLNITSFLEISKMQFTSFCQSTAKLFSFVYCTLLSLRFT